MPGEMLPYLGRAARLAREAVDVSQERMAELLGSDRSAVGQFERGRRWPRYPDATVSAYAAAAGLRPVDIWARAVVLWLADRPNALIAD